MSSSEIPSATIKAMATVKKASVKKDSSAELLAAAARSSGAAFAKAAEAMKSSGPHEEIQKISAEDIQAVREFGRQAEIKGQATVTKTVHTSESIAQYIKEHENTADLQKLCDLLAETRSELDYAKSLLRLWTAACTSSEDFLKGNE